MAPRRPPPLPAPLAAVARGFFSRTLAFLLLFSRFVVTSRTLLHTLLTQSSFLSLALSTLGNSFFPQFLEKKYLRILLRRRRRKNRRGER